MTEQAMIVLPLPDHLRSASSGVMTAEHADAIIKKVIKQRLRLRLDLERRSHSDPDAEDVYQKIILKLIHRVREEEASSCRKIENLNSFVARVAHHVCTDEIRANYPVWTRNKSCVRDLLRRRSELTSWKTGNKTLCGFTGWELKDETEETSDLVDHFEVNTEEFVKAKFPRADLGEVPLSKLVTELLAWINGPLELNRLVDLVTNLQGSKEVVKEPLDDSDRSFELADSYHRVEDELEAAECLAGLWHELNKLPLKQRQAFLLTVKDDLGESILRRFLRDRIVSLQQLCTAMRMDREEILALSTEVPMDADSAANELEATRSLVGLWRHRALKKLEPLLRR